MSRATAVSWALTRSARSSGFAFQETKARNFRTFVGRFSFDLSASLSLPSFSWPSPSWALSLRISWLTSWLSYRPCSSARPSWRPSLRPAGLSSSALPLVLLAGGPSQASALLPVLLAGCPSQASAPPLVLLPGCSSQASELPLVLLAGCPSQASAPPLVLAGCSSQASALPLLAGCLSHRSLVG